MKTFAVFPGTFDPLTNGHVDIIQRASKLFDKVVIAVAKSPSKHTMLSLDERVALAKESVKELENVQVEGFEGMLVDYLQKREANVLIRGIRNSTDYNYESQLFGMYRAYIPNLEIVMLQTELNVSYISSTLVREIVIHNGDIKKLVPQCVYEKLKQK